MAVYVSHLVIRRLLRLLGGRRRECPRRGRGRCRRGSASEADVAQGHRHLIERNVARRGHGATVVGLFLVDCCGLLCAVCGERWA